MVFRPTVRGSEMSRTQKKFSMRTRRKLRGIEPAGE